MALMEGVDPVTLAIALAATSLTLSGPPPSCEDQASPILAYACHLSRSEPMSADRRAARRLAEAGLDRLDEDPAGAADAFETAAGIAFFEGVNFQYTPLIAYAHHRAGDRDAARRALAVAAGQRAVLDGVWRCEETDVGWRIRDAGPAHPDVVDTVTQAMCGVFRQRAIESLPDAERARYRRTVEWLSGEID